MKLLKLQSEENNLTEATFTNNIYSGGVTLPAHAEICLKNLSIDFDQPVYEIISSGTEKNNNFEIQSGKTILASNHIIELTAGKYNLRNLMLEIETKLNNSLDSTISTDYGLQWSIGKNMNNRGDINLLFSFKRLDKTTLNSGTTTLDNITYDSVNSYFYKNTTDNGTYNAKLSANVFVNNGGLQLSCIIKNQTGGNPALSDWVWGIDESKLSLLATQKTAIIALMKACISNDSGYYTFKKGTEMIQPTTPIAIQADDVLTIKKQNGKIIYTVQKGSSPAVSVEGDIINSVIPLLGITKLGGVLHIGNSATGKIAFNTMTITPDCYIAISSGVYTAIQPEEVQDVYFDTNLGVGIPTNIIQLLRFPNKQTRNLLGFSSDDYSKEGVSGIYRGDSGLSINFLSNDLEVEIVELGSINSYSQSSKQLKGIVANIPTASLKNSTIVTGTGTYELSYDETASWAWLSIDNEQPLRLAALTVRCTSNNEILKINGKMTVCLLYKAKSEIN